MTDATQRHGLGGWDWRGMGEGIKKGHVLAEEKRRGVIWTKREEGERERTG